MSHTPDPSRSPARPAAISRLIVHADDFGETAEITRGICAAIEAGAVTSTSIMANMEGTADALPRVAALAERASFGVHLNLCEGEPLTRGRSLLGADGRFCGKRTLFWRAMTRGLSLSELEAEISAQIGLVRDAGVRISHLDGHKHLHQLPVVSEAVARTLPRFGIERVRLTRLGSMFRARAPGALVREWLAVPAGAAFRRARLRSPQRIVDLGHLMRLDDASAATCLRERHGAIEIFCHPGTAQADRDKPGSCERSAELQFLLSERFRTLREAHGLRLITYWDL